MEETPKNDFEKISPTAFMTSLARQFSGIPYAKEIAEKVLLQRSPYLPLLVESRYRAISQAAAAHKAKQVLELGSGYLPRGLEMTADPSVTFVESDLREVIRGKKEVCGALAGGRENLHFAELDATAPPEMYFKCAGVFKPGEPVLVLCEGLLMYLTHGEKAKVCAGVLALLRRHGGAWITTDFTPGVGRSPRADRTMLDRLQKATGRSLADNSFEDLDAAVKFAGEQGFSAETASLLPLAGSLRCAPVMDLRPGVEERLLAAHYVFTLKPKAGV